MEEAHAGVCREHKGQNYMTVSKEWAISGAPWCMIVLTLLGGVTYANYMLTSFINLYSHCTQPLRPSPSRHKGWMS